MLIDQAVFREAATLTVIGLVTTFALLIFLTLVIVIVGRVTAFAARRAGKPAGAAPSGAGDERDRAKAAVIAVGAVMESSARSGPSRGGAP